MARSDLLAKHGGKSIFDEEVTAIFVLCPKKSAEIQIGNWREKNENYLQFTIFSFEDSFFKKRFKTMNFYNQKYKELKGRLAPQLFFARKFTQAYLDEWMANH